MKPLIRILHLEDDPNDVELVQAKLEEAGLTGRLSAVQTCDEFEEALRQDGYDIILADFRLPMYDGILGPDRSPLLKTLKTPKPHRSGFYV